VPVLRVETISDPKTNEYSKDRNIVNCFLLPCAPAVPPLTFRIFRPTLRSARMVPVDVTLDEVRCLVGTIMYFY
jgi:hypothetical protein